MLTENAMKWLMNGRIGLSSKAMLAAALDLESTGDYPHDPSDLNRCLLMLNQVPEARLSFDKISALTPVWGRLIEHWDEMERTFIDEAGLDWTKSTKAPKTYKLMQDVIYNANESLSRL
jgi:hypothetical protein